MSKRMLLFFILQCITVATGLGMLVFATQFDATVAALRGEILFFSNPMRLAACGCMLVSGILFPVIFLIGGEKDSGAT